LSDNYLFNASFLLLLLAPKIMHAAMSKNSQPTASLSRAEFVKESAKPSEDQFINEPEVLRRLPVSRRTLGNWKTSGKIPFIRLPGSRRVLFHWPSVEQALLRQQRGAN
jgi:hypothetical protein